MRRSPTFHAAHRALTACFLGVSAASCAISQQEEVAMGGEVAQLVAEGFPNQAIADHLAISLHTVKTHVHSILAKLGLQSRLQVAVHVHQHGR